MPLVEVDEGALQSLQGNKALLDKLGSNPKTRQALLKLIKEALPNTSIPEIDAAAPHLEQLSALEKKISDMQKAREDEESERKREAAARKANETIETQLNRLRKEGWTDEGLKAVEKLAAERGIPDLEAAAALYEKSLPPDEPSVPNGLDRNWNIATPDNPDDKLQQLLVSSKKGADVYAKSMVPKILQEMRAGQSVRRRA